MNVFKQDLLRSTGVRYVLFTQKPDETRNPAVENGLLSLFRTNPPSYLHRVAEAGSPDVDVYEVVL